MNQSNYNFASMNIKNKIVHICLAIFFSVITNSCTDEIFSQYQSGKELELKVFLTVPAPSLAQTRSGEKNDSYYDTNGIYLLTFDGNTDESRLLQIVKATAGSNIFYARLNENPDAHYVYILANMQNQIASNQDSWKKDGASLGMVKSQLKRSLELDNEIAKEMVSPQPMLGEVYLKDGINSEAMIGSSKNPVELTRSTVKISISTDVGGFQLSGANLMNAPITGYLFNMPESTIKSITKANSGLNGDPEEMIVSTDKEKNECYLYTFESVADTKSTSVIIKASYLGNDSYYRIDLDTKNASYGLIRNCNYLVRIKTVKRVGYGSAEEARNNPAGNIEYTINVVDSYSRDIISNGLYYLGVSNTEFYYFTDNTQMDNIQIATVTQNAPSYIASGSYEASDGISVTNNPFPKNTGTAQSLPLSITMNSRVNEGSVKLKLGDLEREIKVYRMSTPTSFEFGSLFKDFRTKGFISGKVVTGSEDWIKLTTKEIPTEEQLYTSLEDMGENLMIRVKANLGSDSDPEYRTGAIDLFRKDEGGNARIMFRQKLFDVYTPSTEQAKLRPFTYVGTFHRWNHTGERIIRVDAAVAGGGTFDWKAVVISGDFIRLSKTPSSDGGVGVTNFYGDGDNTNYKTDTEVEALQVTDGSTEISGDRTNYIYFRVGLTGKLSSKEAKPRYGVIALIVNYKSASPITRYIYVRQGEAADYLMEKEDPIHNLSKPNRPLAAKISPYNLTDPQGNPHSDLTGRQGEFTQYPSQAGYLYQGYNRQGWWADTYYQEVPPGWGSPGGQEWNKSHETCPTGYRHPSSGIDNTKDESVEDSEMRQSMWIYPQNKMLSNTQNFIVGYLADGFYDRRPMWNKIKFESAPEQPSAVSNGAEIAYMGVLGFNPRTLASIFFPLAGFYTEAPAGKFMDAGISGGFRTKTRFSGNSIWSVDYGYMYPSISEGIFDSKKYRVDNYTHTSTHTTSVRCVKD